MVLTAYWLARDKRGVSTICPARELKVRYATAWLIGPKPVFPRWLLPIADNGSTMGIRTRFRP